jgi:Uma2 family endonuclease
VQQTPGGTQNHAELVVRFLLAASHQLDAAVWLVTSQSRSVDTPITIRYPDVVVEAPRPTGKSLATSEPVIIVEVLSPNTGKLDLNVKPQEYTGLPSLLAYVAASQDRPECRVWQRRADGSFADGPDRIGGPRASITIEALRLSLDLDEIYHGIA